MTIEAIWIENKANGASHKEQPVSCEWPTISRDITAMHPPKHVSRVIHPVHWSTGDPHLSRLLSFRWPHRRTRRERGTFIGRSNTRTKTETIFLTACEHFYARITRWSTVMRIKFVPERVKRAHACEWTRFVRKARGIARAWNRNPSARFQSEKSTLRALSLRASVCVLLFYEFSLYDDIYGDSADRQLPPCFE